MKILKWLGIVFTAIVAIVGLSLVWLTNTRPDFSEFDAHYAPPATSAVTVRIVDVPTKRTVPMPAFMKQSTTAITYSCSTCRLASIRPGISAFASCARRMRAWTSSSFGAMNVFRNSENCSCQTRHSNMLRPSRVSCRN